MRPAIIDEFTQLKVSRQRKYQLRMQRDKRCSECRAGDARHTVFKASCASQGAAAEKARVQT